MVQGQKIKSIRLTISNIAEKATALSRRLNPEDEESPDRTESFENLLWLMKESRGLKKQADELSSNVNAFVRSAELARAGKEADGENKAMSDTEVSTQEPASLPSQTDSDSPVSNTELFLLKHFQTRFESLEKDKSHLKLMNEQLLKQVGQANNLSEGLMQTLRGKEVVIEQLFSTIQQKDLTIKDLRSSKMQCVNLAPDQVYGDRKASSSSEMIYYKEESSEEYQGSEDVYEMTESQFTESKLPENEIEVSEAQYSQYTQNKGSGDNLESFSEMNEQSVVSSQFEKPGSLVESQDISIKAPAPLALKIPKIKINNEQSGQESSTDHQKVQEKVVEEPINKNMSTQSTLVKINLQADEPKKNHPKKKEMAKNINLEADASQLSTQRKEKAKNFNFEADDVSYGSEDQEDPEDLETVVPSVAPIENNRRSHSFLRDANSERNSERETVYNKMLMANCSLPQNLNNKLLNRKQQKNQREDTILIQSSFNSIFVDNPFTQLNQYSNMRTNNNLAFNFKPRGSLNMSTIESKQGEVEEDPVAEEEPEDGNKRETQRYKFPQQKKIHTVTSQIDPSELSSLSLAGQQPLYKILYNHNWRGRQSQTNFINSKDPSQLRLRVSQNECVSPLFKDNDDITILAFKSEDSFLMVQFGIGFILVDQGRIVQVFRHPMVSMFYDVVYAGGSYYLYEYFSGIWSKPTQPSDLIFCKNAKLNSKWTGRSLGVALGGRVLLCNRRRNELTYVPVLGYGALSNEEILISSRSVLKGSIQDFKTVRNLQDTVLVLSSGGSLMAYKLSLEQRAATLISVSDLEVLEGRKEECFTMAVSDCGQFIAVHLMMDERLASRIIVLRTRNGLTETRPMSWIDLYKRNLDYFQAGTFLPTCKEGFHLFFFISDSESESAIFTIAIDLRKGVKVREIGKLKRRIDVRFPRKVQRLCNCTYTSGYDGNLVKILYKA